MGSRAAALERRTLLLVTAAALLESAGESLLPAMYREVSAALGASPAALGSITLCRALAQALCYPLAVWAAARFDRARVVAAGTFLCAAATTLVGASATLPQMAIARGLNGMGMALVVPPASSLVADCSDDETRGSAFGWLFMAQSVGAAMGTSLGVLLAPNSFLGVPGWRLALHALALVSVAIALSTWLLAADTTSRPGTLSTKATDTVAELAREAKVVVSVPTFWIIVAQGATGQVPWSALTFMPMWLELVGLSHWETTVVASLNCLSNGLGSLLAGFAGDLAARRLPDTGRVALAQASNVLAIPVAALLLLVAQPSWPLAGTVYAGGFLLLGVAMGWSTVSTSSPIFAEIVPEKARTAVYALDLCFENVVASFGAPVVGILAERVFGYRPRAAASGGTSAQAADRENAAALGKAILAEIAVPATICCLTYSAVYWTYPADRRRARMMAAAGAQQEASGDRKNRDCEAASGSAVASAADDGLNQALLSISSPPSPSVAPVRRDASLPSLPPSVLEADQHLLSLDPLNDLVSMDITIPSESINRVRAELSGSFHGGQTCTTFEVALAVLWRCRTRAISRPDDPETPVLLAFAADVRRHVGAKQGYYGNCIVDQFVVARSGAVADGDVKDVVMAIKRAKDQIPDLLKEDDGEGMVVALQEMRKVRAYDTLIVTSWRNLGFEQVDFGSGAPARVTSSGKDMPPAPGALGFLRSGSGGVSVLSALVREEHADAFHAELAKFT